MYSEQTCEKIDEEAPLTRKCKPISWRLTQTQRDVCIYVENNKTFKVINISKKSLISMGVNRVIMQTETSLLLIQINSNY